MAMQYGNSNVQIEKPAGKPMGDSVADRIIIHQDSSLSATQRLLRIRSTDWNVNSDIIDIVIVIEQII